jgi:uncharacterized RDD family membrane protein YckC
MDQNVFHYQTSEKVRIEYEIAPLFHRCVALLIDAAIKVLAFLGIYVLLIFFALGSVVLSQHVNLGNLPPLVMVVLIIAFSLFMLFYGLVFEWLWKGQTPGKRIMRLRAVHDDGTFIGFTSAVLRNIFRLIDMLPAGYLVGFVCSVLNRKRKRVGDYVAGTFITRERGKEIPKMEIDGENIFSSVNNLDECLTPSLRDIIDSYLRSRTSMERRALERVESELSALIENRTGCKRPDGITPHGYIASFRKHFH